MATSPLQTTFNYKPKNRRNGMDLSYRFANTLPVGMLQPFCVHDCNPGDHLVLSVNDSIKALNLSSMNFLRLTAHFDFFFVPYRQLWSWWPQFMSQTDDISSSLYSYTPGEGNRTIRCPKYVPRMPAATVFSLVANPTGSAPTAKFDDLGYNIVDSTFRLFYSLQYDPRYWGQIATGTGAPNGTVSRTGTSNYDVTKVPDLNPFRFAAYQKIYSDWFRNTDYESNDPETYNFDYLLGASSGAGYDEVTSTQMLKLIKIRYALWPRDYATSLKPSINYLPPITSSSGAYGNAQWFTGDQPYVSGTAINFGGQISTSNNTSSIEISSLRNAYALERMMMISERAPKYYSAMMQAHWGENFNTRDDNRCYRVGSTSHVISVNQVVSTAETSEGSIGQLGAFGSGKSNRNSFKFDAHEHGVLMGIMYITPLADYEGYQLNPFNRKFMKGDYYQPEFDSLGMQPLQYSDLFGIGSPGTEASLGGSLSTGVLGWQNRYLEYKSAFDVVSPFFKDSYPSWTAPRDPEKMLQGYSSGTSIPYMEYFHVNPAVVDDVFLQKYDGTHMTDHFLAYVSNSSSFVRNMAIDGTPLNIHHVRNT